MLMAANKKLTVFLNGQHPAGGKAWPHYYVNNAAEGYPSIYPNNYHEARMAIVCLSTLYTGDILVGGSKRDQGSWFDALADTLRYEQEVTGH